MSPWSVPLPMLKHPGMVLIPSVLSLFAVLVLIPVVSRWAKSTGFVDAPGGRKQHEDAVPPVGGLVIFPVFILISVLFLPSAADSWPLFAGIAILLVTGSLDDRYHLDAWAKFLIQFLIALAVVMSGGARLYHLGDLFGFGNFGLGFLSIPFSIAAVMLLINAMNLIDGLDGLAGGLGFIVFLWLIIACMAAGIPGPVAAMGPLAGALAGFLFYNLRHPFRKQAVVFLGDAGSMALGLVMAWYCIGLARSPESIIAPMAVAWILALPIFDICAQFYRRVKEGRHPFAPDRGHFHHHFIHAGLTPGRAVALILLLAFVLGGAGYGGLYTGVPPALITLAWIGMLLGHMKLSEKPDVYIALIGKFVHRFKTR